MARQDFHSTPIRRMVVIGESNAYGMNACRPENEWVQVLGKEIRDAQASPLRVFNNAIPSNVISPDAPGYKPGDVYRTAPAAIERYEQDMIAYEPDMAVFAYGLNDSRCGHSVASFMQAYRSMVTRVREQCPKVAPGSWRNTVLLLEGMGEVKGISKSRLIRDGTQVKVTATQ